MRAGRGIRARLRRLERHRGGGQPTSLRVSAWAKLTAEQIDGIAATGELPDGVSMAELLGPSWLKLTDAELQFIIDNNGRLPPGVDAGALMDDGLQLTDEQVRILCGDGEAPRGILINAPPVPSR
jgi:hypothetical protein